MQLEKCGGRAKMFGFIVHARSLQGKWMVALYWRLNEKGRNVRPLVNSRIFSLLLKYSLKCELGRGFTLPSQRPTSLVLNHSRFKEVFLFTQIHDFAHPWEWVLRAGELFF